jgi:hypothetical protein
LRQRIAFAFLLAAAAAAGEQRLITLFDGKDTRQWQPGFTNWVIEDGVLALKGRNDAKEHNDNYLWTKEQYGDFVLELEFKVLLDPAARWQGGNSGVFLRTSDLKDPVQTGIEVQIGNYGPDKQMGRGLVGGIYHLVAPAGNLHKSGEWNKYVIACEGPKISVKLNGEPSAEADLDRWTEAGKNPDGSPNKFKRPLREFARRGYIGLQDHGLPVWYRNIRIRRLDR